MQSCAARLAMRVEGAVWGGKGALGEVCEEAMHLATEGTGRGKNPGARAPFVVVVGAPGCGKSAVCREVARHVAESGAEVLTLGHPMEGSLAAFVEELKRQARGIATKRKSSAQLQVGGSAPSEETSFGQVTIGDSDSDMEDGSVAATDGEASVDLGVDVDVLMEMDEEGLDAEDDEAVRKAVCAFVQRLARHVPLLIVLEGLDTFCSDGRGDTSEFFDRKCSVPSLLADIVSEVGSPVCCLATSRRFDINEIIPDRVRSRGVKALFLRSLTHDETVEFFQFLMVCENEDTPEAMRWNTSMRGLFASQEFKEFADTAPIFGFGASVIKMLALSFLSILYACGRKAITFEQLVRAADSVTSAPINEIIAASLTEDDLFVLVALALMPECTTKLISPEHIKEHLLGCNAPKTFDSSMIGHSLAKLCSMGFVASPMHISLSVISEGFVPVRLAIPRTDLMYIVTIMNNTRRASTELFAFAQKLK